MKKKKEKQDIERTVMLGAAGREGSMELTDFNEFWRVYAMMNFLEEAEKNFKKQYVQEVDLGCSIDMLRKMGDVPEKYRFFIAVEQGENMRYELRGYDSHPFEGWNNGEEMEKQAVAKGLDLFVLVLLNDGRALMMSSSFNGELEKAKPKAEEMWEGMNNIMDNVKRNGTYKD